MSVLSAIPVGTRSRRPVDTASTSARSKHDFGAITHVFTATARHVFAATDPKHPKERRDHPARYAYLESALMAREMDRL
jgi:hypothetical protein